MRPTLTHAMLPDRARSFAAVHQISLVEAEAALAARFDIVDAATHQRREQLYVGGDIHTGVPTLEEWAAAADWQASWEEEWPSHYPAESAAAWREHARTLRALAEKRR